MHPTPTTSCHEHDTRPNRHEAPGRRLAAGHSHNWQRPGPHPDVHSWPVAELIHRTDEPHHAPPPAVAEPKPCKPGLEHGAVRQFTQFWRPLSSISKAFFLAALEIHPLLLAERGAGRCLRLRVDGDRCIRVRTGVFLRKVLGQHPHRSLPALFHRRDHLEQAQGQPRAGTLQGFGQIGLEVLVLLIGPIAPRLLRDAQQGVDLRVFQPGLGGLLNLRQQLRRERRLATGRLILRRSGRGRLATGSRVWGL